MLRSVGRAAARLGTHAVLAVIWLLHFLPLPILAMIGRGFGLLLYCVILERRRVGLTNLRLCFPDWSESKRRALLRRHFQAFGRAIVERGIVWWSSRDRIMRLVRIEGLENWRSVADRPVIWLAPHFVGLDAGGTRIAAEYAASSMYSRQRNPVLERILYHGRTRFVMPRLFSRQEGLRAIVRAMREGLPFYYLPDMDFGPRDSVFVPFFNVPAATITGLARLAKLARAAVVPVITRQLPGGRGYEVRFYPAWSDFPTEDTEADARRMNAFIEERVLEMPEQYHWLHKRFKTRPAGEPRIY
ncbi:MAG TPA: lipid A biosynthesis acyltransferase [Burkholderiales bacterium]|nr:lipid A biosynthesis acyltransferase [Burkholderiales bacterium]